jgi:hypothetical protein
MCPLRTSARRADADFARGPLEPTSSDQPRLCPAQSGGFECNGDVSTVGRSRGRYTPREMGYWSIVGPVWDAIDIYSGPDVFKQTFGSVPRASGLLFAAHFCQSEICNGGFHQFLGNSTGVLAAEAVEGFHEIGQHQVAALIEKAMSFFGSAYPRDRKERQTRLEQVSRSSLDALDDLFYSLIDSEAGGFTAAADRCSNSKVQ